MDVQRPFTSRFQEPIRCKSSRIKIFLVCFLFATITASAQVDYFQQEVAYDISVSLDDQGHYLNGFITISYKNNSSDTLDFLWMHLWPNAYSGRNTALSRQLLEDGNKKLYFSKSKEQGFIDKLDFKANGEQAAFSHDAVHKDIGKIVLPDPLLPGKSVELTTPFRVKFPDGKFSRLGHIGESYQVTQWYPKPAVYDKNGWHQMPYLDKGEFYSEFGRFRVSITLPENYVVAATGILQDNNEISWLDEKARITREIDHFEESMDFPPSSAKLKTITYTQDSIHDFAWFADKRFHVLKNSFVLSESGKPVTAWAYFTNREAALWKNSLAFIENGIRFYSGRVGAYPYSHYTAIDGTISAGEGMEYPMITVIGRSQTPYKLESVIVHELGHNWFYGILGNNEREHGWMDEGINTFYEMGYFEHHYPGKASEGKNDLGGGTALGAVLGTNKFTMRDGMKQVYRFSAFDNSDQPIKTSSEDFTGTNYGTVMYGKTALAFSFLKDYLGEKIFDDAMQSYYRKWKFRHPQPDDLKRVFEEVSNRDLDWFFDDMLGTNVPVRYKLKKISNAETGGATLSFRNKGKMAVPLKLREAGKKATWVDGFMGDKSVVLKDYSGGDLLINEDHTELLKSKRSRYRDRSILRNMPDFRLRLLPGLTKDPDTETLMLLPMAAWNRYNHGMAGLVFSNFSYIPKQFEFSLTPLYDFTNTAIAGTGSVNYTVWPLSGFIKSVGFSVKGKRFAYSDNLIAGATVDETQPVFNYNRVVPGILFQLRKNNLRSKLRQWVLYRNISLWLEEVQYQVSGASVIRNNVTTYLNYHNLKYGFSNLRTLDPFHGFINLETGKQYAKLSGELNYRFSYAKFNKGINVRVFAGGFLDNGGTHVRNYNFRLSGGAGYQDYLFDEYYFGRTDDHGFWNQQFLVVEGGFKIPTFVGQSNKWIAALNLDIDLPVPVPVSIFADFGTYEGISKVFDDLNNTIMFDGGIALKPIRGILEVYIPLFYSDDINKTLEVNKIQFAEQIRFVLNINKLTPYKLRERILEIR